MKKWLVMVLISVFILPALAKSTVALQHDTPTVSPKHPFKPSTANCYSVLADPIKTPNNLTYFASINPGCSIQIAVKPLINLNTKTYAGNFCITSDLNDSDCNSSQSDGFTVGPSGSAHSPDPYTNASKKVKYVRMFDCSESSSPGQPKPAIKPSCHDIFEISEAQ